MQVNWKQVKTIRKQNMGSPQEMKQQKKYT